MGFEKGLARRPLLRDADRRMSPRETCACMTGFTVLNGSMTSPEPAIRSALGTRWSQGNCCINIRRREKSDGELV